MQCHRSQRPILYGKGQSDRSRHNRFLFVLRVLRSRRRSHGMGNGSKGRGYGCGSAQRSVRDLGAHRNSGAAGNRAASGGQNSATVRRKMGCSGQNARGSQTIRDQNRNNKTNKTMTQKHVILKMTRFEATMLRLVVGNGWGDGDFAEWLGNKKYADGCRRSMDKLDAALLRTCDKPSDLRRRKSQK